MEFSITLDATDWRLLDLLQADASLTNHALAQAAHVSPATALRRVRRLREEGVIERFTALLGAPLAGQGLQALCEVTLDRQGAELLDDFEARAVDEPLVQQCWRVSPGPDFVLVVWAPDMPTFQALTQRLFTQDANVRNVKSFFALKRAKFDPRVPVETLADRADQDTRR
ncbi:Lrp/AsnC family transcriptional regulator [Ideonella sp. B7]|uniref:Lrp/AsnC family transcriptional regulator n=1 Tax=Ideonella benzenivorans TaxID=2831643 RepID=UPI001CED77B5|nr:Lrp/AsnC family transcriptional regulator [Ideonella benzenivorans]MCA6217185.1 Lrp/AsnC family transcriptional regulator [Ideonella benzenivorans]